MKLVDKQLSEKAIEILGKLNTWESVPTSPQIQHFILNEFICEIHRYEKEERYIPQWVNEETRKHLFSFDFLKPQQYMPSVSAEGITYDTGTGPIVYGFITDYVGLHMLQNNCRFAESVEKLAIFYQLKLFDPPLVSSLKTDQIYTLFKKNDFSEKYWPIEIRVNDILFKENFFLPLTTPSGTIYAWVIEYKSYEGYSLLFPAKIERIPTEPSFYNDYRVPGYIPYVDYLLYEDELHLCSFGTTVLLCCDPLLSRDLNQLFASKPEKIIATSHPYGPECITRESLGGLRGKQVVYIPSVHMKSLERVEEIAEFAIQNEVQSFEVLPTYLLRFGLNCNHEDIQTLPKPWERHFLSKAVPVSTSDFKRLIEVIEKESLELETFMEWGRQEGLFRSETSKFEQLENALNAKPYSWQNIDNDETHTQRAIFLDALVVANDISIVLGPPEIGKSMLTASIAVAYATGCQFLEFLSMPPKRVLYLDGESKEENFLKQISSAANALKAEEKNAKDNISYICFREIKESINWDFTEVNIKDRLTNLFTNDKYSLLIIDNLLSFLPGIRRKGNKWEIFFKNILELINAFNITVLLVHHVNDSGEAAGTKDIEAQCKTVLRLEPLLPEIRNSLGDGAAFKATFVKNKVLTSA